jgi:hypothetical protein
MSELSLFNQCCHNAEAAGFGSEMKYPPGWVSEYLIPTELQGSTLLCDNLDKRDHIKNLNILYSCSLAKMLV